MNKGPEKGKGNGKGNGERREQRNREREMERTRGTIKKRQWRQKEVMRKQRN